jgi:hypothetical protein
MFLFKRFPVLYKQIASGYLEYRNALRQRWRAVLRADVRNAVDKFACKGLYVSVNNVLPLLTSEAARDRKLIRRESDRSMEDLGCGGLEPNLAALKP